MQKNHLPHNVYDGSAFSFWGRLYPNSYRIIIRKFQLGPTTQLNHSPIWKFINLQFYVLIILFPSQWNWSKIFISSYFPFSYHLIRFFILYFQLKLMIYILIRIVMVNWHTFYKSYNKIHIIQRSYILIFNLNWWYISWFESFESWYIYFQFKLMIHILIIMMVN